MSSDNQNLSQSGDNIVLQSRTKLKTKTTNIRKELVARTRPEHDVGRSLNVPRWTPIDIP